MSGTIHYMEQRSDEWLAHRVGRVTASKIVDIMATTKSGPSASRGNYAAEIIAERLTGESAESGFTNAAMQWGIDQEPHAIAAYSFMHDTDVEAVGFIDHPTIDLSGCSPDGLIGTQGMCEIKCPNTKTHLDTLMGGVDPEEVHAADAVADGLLRQGVVRFRQLRSTASRRDAASRRAGAA
jgi:hypothetical protein